MKRVRLVIVVAVLVALGLVVYGFALRAHRLSALNDIADEQAIVPVDIITATAGTSTRALTLPGTVRAWYEAPIFAQVSGYVKNWYQDYGANVKSGQLLATIDAPAVDANFAGAKAQLRVAQTRHQLALTTAARWQALAGGPAVSKQEVDVQVAGAEAAKAEVEAQQQNVARYAALNAFKSVVAPFDGVVTSRLTDVGNYVNAAGGDAGARNGSTELFRIADIHKLRVFVFVPQDYASGLADAPKATIHLPSQPEHAIEATFLTTARAFDSNTRTVVTELTVENPGHSLWPGTYVDVVFQIPTDPAVPTVPEQALMFRAAGSQIAVVDDQNRIHLRSVTLGQNLGQLVQVTAGVSAGDKLVNNPAAGLLEGQLVRPVTPMPGYGAALPNPQPGPPPKDGPAGKP